MEHALGDAAPLGDLFEVVHRALGIDVCSVVAPKTEHGLLMKDVRTGRVCIAVAVTDHPMRQRSSVAHELGHLLAGDLDLASRGVSGKRDAGEVQADAFARHLLLPVPAVTGAGLLQESETSVLSDVVQAYGVSPALAAIQLRDARRIDESTCSAWQRWSSRQLAAVHGWLDRYDRMALESEQPRPPQGLVTRAVAAYQAGVLGVTELAVWYGRPIAELEAELGVPGPRAIVRDEADPWDKGASIFPASGPS